MTTSIRAALLSASMIALALAAAGCDSKATASGPTVIPPERMSKELESCAATSDCGEGLRCLDQACQREARSTVGDFLAVRGARALADGDVGAAILAYTEAAAEYERQKLTVPPDLDCAQGRALVAARAQKDKAELAARLLHRCLLAMPPGGHLRTSALASLAELDRSGFDAHQLARPQLADVYLTRAPSKPDSGSLTVTISPEPMPKGKSWPIIADRLGKPDVKAALLSCWDAAYAAHEQRELAVKVALKGLYIASEYEDEPGKFTLTAEPAAGGDADSAACVKAAILAPIPELKALREGFVTALAVTVK